MDWIIMLEKYTAINFRKRKHSAKHIAFLLSIKTQLPTNNILSKISICQLISGSRKG